MISVSVTLLGVLAYSADKNIPASILGTWKVKGYSCENADSCKPNKDDETVTVTKYRLVMRRGVDTPFIFIAPNRIVVENDKYILRLDFETVTMKRMLVKIKQKIKGSYGNTLDVYDCELWEKTKGSIATEDKVAEKPTLSEKYLVGKWISDGRACSSDGSCEKPKNYSSLSFVIDRKGSYIENRDIFPFTFSVSNEKITINLTVNGKKGLLVCDCTPLNENLMLLRLDTIQAEGKKKKADEKYYERFRRTK